MLVRKGKPIRRCGQPTAGIVGTAHEIRAMESKGGVPSCDGPLTPCDGLRVNLDTLIAAAQIADQTDREIANPGADIENPVLRPKAPTDQFRPRSLAPAVEGLWAQSPIVVHAQVRRRKQRVASPTDDALDRRDEPVDRASCAACQSLDHLIATAPLSHRSRSCSTGDQRDPKGRPSSDLPRAS